MAVRIAVASNVSVCVLFSSTIEVVLLFLFAGSSLNLVSKNKRRRAKWEYKCKWLKKVH